PLLEPIRQWRRASGIRPAATPAVYLQPIAARIPGAMRALLKMILKPHLVEVDPAVGLLDAAVGEVLVAIRQIERALCAEAVADAQMITELEAGAEPLVAQGGLREEVRSDCEFAVEPLQVVLLEAEYRRQPHLDDIVVLPGPDVVVVPVAQSEIPIA